MIRNQHGLTLLEVMISMLIFSMISVLIFSILDRAALFTTKGEAQVRAIEQQYNLVSLIRRQVQGAWIDTATKKVRLQQPTDQQFSIITTASIMYPSPTLVIAFYDFDPESGVLYYSERRDFYNPDYSDQFPEREEMITLLTTTSAFQLQMPEESSSVSLTFAGEQYTFHPMCIQQEDSLADNS